MTGKKSMWRLGPGLNWPNIIVAVIGVAVVMAMFEFWVEPPLEEAMQEAKLLADPNLF